MPNPKVQLANRAPETQSVLRRISGWGINWGITLVMVLFIGLLFAAFEVKFDQPVVLPLQAESSWEAVAEPSEALASVETASLELKGETYTLTRTKQDANGQVRFRSNRELPELAEFPFPISAQTHESVNVVAIIFKGLF